MIVNRVEIVCDCRRELLSKQQNSDTHGRKGESNRGCDKGHPLRYQQGGTMDLRQELTGHLHTAGIEHFDRMVLGLSVRRLVYHHLVIELGKHGYLRY